MDATLADHNRDLRIVRILLAALLLGLAMTLLVGLASYIAAQPTSILRNVFILPAHLIKWAWFGAVISVAALIVLLRAQRTFLRAASILFVIALIALLLVQTEIVSAWVLPPPVDK